MISHGNTVHNQRVIQAACKTDQESTVVSWLPLYHDMGLVGTVLQPAYLGARSVLMAPTKFLQNPARWLRSISRYRAHSSTAPNFAYELCSQKVTPEQKKGLDLTTWRVAVNGAEPVRFECMERFVATFGDCGFHAEAFFPCYGLAESTLMVTGGRNADLPIVKKVSSQALEKNVVRPGEDGEITRLLVGCGSGLLGQEVRIVNPRTREACQDDVVGEIWVSGPSVGQGYWNRSEETSVTFRAYLAPNGEGPYLRTGDLGFLSDNQLFITGRLKDLLIIRGRNLYPQDIELTIQNCHPSLQLNCGAAFTVEVEGQDTLVVVNEVEQRLETSPEKLTSMIRNAILLEHGVLVHAIVLVKNGTIPKTTSGKIKRSVCRNRYLESSLEAVANITYGTPQIATTYIGSQPSRSEVLQTHPDLRHELIEASLQDYVARMLKVSPKEISSDQPMINLGIDSLSAVELTNFIDTWLGLKLDTLDVLAGCTVGDLVTMICGQLSANEEASVEHQESSEESYPLSYGQRGLWILHQAAPQSSAYLLASAVRVRKGLDVEALRHAFQGMMNRHPMLRTIFPLQRGGPVQIIRRDVDLSAGAHFQQIDVQISGSDHLPDLLAKEAQRPFDLEKEPPVRLTVFQLSSGESALMLMLHHIIADLWSIGILLQDLSILYSAQRGEKAVILSEVQSSYLDFVRWQANTVDGPRSESLLQYWVGQLSGELPVLQLPTDHPRPAIQSYRGSSESIYFNRQLYCKILELARTENATPFMVLVAAFQILLHRISGQDDLLLGSPTSGRSKSSFSNVVGYYVNPIVLRSHYDAALPFTSYLMEARQVILEGFKHQDYPFTLLVEKLHPQRMAGVPRVFQAMFVWQKAYGGQLEALASMALGEAGMTLELGELSLESIKLENNGSQFDLTLMMTESDAGLLGTFKYSTDLFDAATIRRFGGQFSALLEGLIHDPQKQISAIPLLNEAEREHLIVEWTSIQPVQPPNDRCIHELFQEQAQRNPEAIGLIVGEKRLTYAQLNSQANQFARYLRGFDVGSEVRVGLYLDRSVEMIVALLGIWKAGGAYVPFDIRDPKERVASLIDRSSIAVLITHEQLLDRLPSKLPKIVLLDLDLDAIALEGEADLDASVSIRSLAYMIYTSGSTGEPKGVMIEHRSLTNLLGGLKNAIYHDDDERSLVVGLNAPLSFDSSIKQLLTLTMGHTLCLIPEDLRRNGEALLAYARDTRLQVLDCTPTQVQLLLEAGFAQNSDRPLMLLVGGEPIPDDMWKLLARNGRGACYNVYGPTECTVDATACRIDLKTQTSIGRPLSGTSVYLLGQDLEPVPTGVPGELFIGGDSVGRGYLEHPDLTGVRFVPDPFSAVSGSRMYRTGDRARYLPDGNIQFIGRVDRQVKVRGFRVELEEVETALADCEGVKDAAVMVRNTPNGSKQLMGYVVAIEQRASNYYRQSLIRKIPEYMVPAIVVSVPSIPTSANGKRDYAALPIPEFVAVATGSDYAPPTSPIEDYLARLWTDALRVQPIGIHDNFFALGGDSLQATRIVTRIQESYPTDIPLLTLFFQQPTIAELAPLIVGGSQSNA
jgi:amino acid adenylation domain-containing protein